MLRRGCWHTAKGRKLEVCDFTTRLISGGDGMSAVVLRSKRAAKRESAAGAKAVALRTRGKPVSDSRKAPGRQNCAIRLKLKPCQFFLLPP